jgi:V/A-type H+-transporting ATPase subunit I
VSDPSDFDLEATIARVTANRQHMRQTTDRRDFLAKRVRDLAPWGDFAFPAGDELAGQKLWFYVVPHKEMARVRDAGLVYATVHRDQRYCYVAVVAPDEPPAGAMPVARTHTGARPRSELERELERVEIEIEDVVAERHELTKWLLLIAANLAQAEDRAACELVAAQALEEAEFFVIQAWMKADDLAAAEAFAAEHQLAMIAELPRPDDDPPTLLQNPPAAAAGEDLVEFYKTPAYGEWDPSPIVFYSFVLFFAMIMADAGYGLVLAALVGYFWTSMGTSATGVRLRRLGAGLAGGTIAFGILRGGYFGFSPAPDTVLGWLDLIDLNDIDTMMKLSITIGVSHIVLASVLKARRATSTSARLQPLGWSAAALGGLLMYLGHGGFGASIGVALLVAGIAMVAAFASDRAVGSAKGLALRALDGLMSLAGISKMFGDILSYMRLFALGLAGSSLALTVNDLAGQVAHALPGIGILLAALIVLFGHVVNLALCVMSGVVHGLRLNVIEFFNWGLTEEGRPFRPFAKKEVRT